MQDIFGVAARTICGEEVIMSDGNAAPVILPGALFDRVLAATGRSMADLAVIADVEVTASRRAVANEAMAADRFARLSVAGIASILIERGVLPGPAVGSSDATRSAEERGHARRLVTERFPGLGGDGRLPDTLLGYLNEIVGTAELRTRQFATVGELLDYNEQHRLAAAFLARGIERSPNDGLGLLRLGAARVRGRIEPWSTSRDILERACQHVRPGSADHAEALTRLGAAWFFDGTIPLDDRLRRARELCDQALDVAEKAADAEAWLLVMTYQNAGVVRAPHFDSTDLPGTVAITREAIERLKLTLCHRPGHARWRPRKGADGAVTRRSIAGLESKLADERLGLPVAERIEAAARAIKMIDGLAKVQPRERFPDEWGRVMYTSAHAFIQRGKLRVGAPACGDCKAAVGRCDRALAAFSSSVHKERRDVADTLYNRAAARHLWYRLVRGRPARQNILRDAAAADYRAAIAIYEEIDEGEAKITAAALAELLA